MTYRKRLLNGFRNAYRVLKPEHYMVVTFHHQKIQEWNDFVSALRESGFVFEKITHQYNRRSGESNVANPYGTTGSDFYIRCKKTNAVNVACDRDEFSLFVIEKTKSILAGRGEATPFDFLINGLLPLMLEEGYLEAPVEELRKILNREIGPEKKFCVTENPSNKGGDIFWFNHPEKYINHASIRLMDRVDMSIKALLRRKVSLKYDDIVAEVFKEFPNGNTPDPRNLVNVVKRYANQSNGKWKLKPEIEQESTEHTHVIALLCKLAVTSGMASHVGNREKPEIVRDAVRLSDLSKLKNLKCLSTYNSEQLSRIEMIDMVWIKTNSDEVETIFEVENSTDFVGAVMRGSHLPADIPKFMVIPKRREMELRRFRDPLFVNDFRMHSWKYLLYEDVELLSTARKMSIVEISNVAKEIEG